MGPAFRLSEEHPHPHHQGDLEDGDGMEVVRKRLLARLVPEQRPPGIGPRRPADQRERQEVRLARPPLAPTRPRSLRPRLVDPESGKGCEVHRDQPQRDVERGQEGMERIHWQRIARRWLAGGCEVRQFW